LDPARSIAVNVDGSSDYHRKGSDRQVLNQRLASAFYV
jgi:hypothetical protein